MVAFRGMKNPRFLGWSPMVQDRVVGTVAAHHPIHLPQGDFTMAFAVLLPDAP
jgi:hypothetical protein